MKGIGNAAMDLRISQNAESFLNLLASREERRSVKLKEFTV